MKNWKENLKLEDNEFITSYYSQFFKTEIQIIFLDTDKHIGLKQTELVNQLIETEKNWIENSIAAIIKYYKKTYPDYKKGWEMGGADIKTLEEVLPKEIDKEKLVKIITPEEICIQPENDCKKGSFGFVLGCDWDEEHGIGVVFKNWNIIDVGGMDVAFNY